MERSKESHCLTQTVSVPKFSVNSFEAPLLFLEMRIPKSEDLWAEAMMRVCDYLNRSASTANLCRISPHDMWHKLVARINVMYSLPLHSHTYNGHEERPTAWRPVVLPGTKMQPIEQLAAYLNSIHVCDYFDIYHLVKPMPTQEATDNREVY